MDCLVKLFISFSFSLESQLLGEDSYIFSLYMIYLEHFDKETFPVAYSVRELFQYLGITAIPVLLEQLREEYGLSGSYLIMGALVWNCMISGVLMKSKRPPPQSVDHDHAHESSESAKRKDESAGPDDKTEETRMGNLLMLFSIEPATRHPLFTLCIIIHSLLSYSFVVWAVFLVPFGKTLGLPSDVAVLLSVFGGIGGLFGKIVVLFVFLSNRMNAITCSVIPATICTVSLSGYIFYQDFWTLAVSSLFCGFSLAYADCALCGILPRYVCKVHVRQGVAISNLFSGALMQLGGIISGALLDISGSFTIIFSIVIFINIASIVLALGMHKMDGTIIECNE
ncbi:uncharacterized protein [Apostichopus japonicus]|uniref:uncharacterized protein isoform X1 n=1 Tax=Stichopus japonicus TaxID=307972 RepID=UPI003AB2459E